MELLENEISCPYCGESISILIDDSALTQDYYEDCSVCCRPIRIQQNNTHDGGCNIVVLRDDE